jgi:hypothetical protein
VERTTYAAPDDDLNVLRQNLNTTQTNNPEVYQQELEPYLNRLEAKYGNNLPPGRIGMPNAGQVNRLLKSLRAKYGNRIPVDHAYRIMQDLEADLRPELTSLILITAITLAWAV